MWVIWACWIHVFNKIHDYSKTTSWIICSYEKFSTSSYAPAKHNCQQLETEYLDRIELWGDASYYPKLSPDNYAPAVVAAALQVAFFGRLGLLGAAPVAMASDSPKPRCAPALTCNMYSVPPYQALATFRKKNGCEMDLI